MRGRHLPDQPFEVLRIRLSVGQQDDVLGADADAGERVVGIAQRRENRRRTAGLDAPDRRRGAPGRLSRTRPSGTSQVDASLNVSTPSICDGASALAAPSAADFDSSIAVPFMLHDRSSTITSATAGSSSRSKVTGSTRSMSVWRYPRWASSMPSPNTACPPAKNNPPPRSSTHDAKRRHRLGRERRARHVVQQHHIPAVERLGTPRQRLWARHRDLETGARERVGHRGRLAPRPPARRQPCRCRHARTAVAAAARRSPPARACCSRTPRRAQPRPPPRRDAGRARRTTPRGGPTWHQASRPGARARGRAILHAALISAGCATCEPTTTSISVGASRDGRRAPTRTSSIQVSPTSRTGIGRVNTGTRSTRPAAPRHARRRRRSGVHPRRARSGRCSTAGSPPGRTPAPARGWSFRSDAVARACRCPGPVAEAAKGGRIRQRSPRGRRTPGCATRPAGGGVRRLDGLGHGLQRPGRHALRSRPRGRPASSGLPAPTPPAAPALPTRQTRTSSRASRRPRRAPQRAGRHCPASQTTGSRREQPQHTGRAELERHLRPSPAGATSPTRAPPARRPPPRSRPTTAAALRPRALTDRAILRQRARHQIRARGIVESDAEHALARRAVSARYRPGAGRIADTRSSSVVSASDWPLGETMRRVEGGRVTRPGWWRTPRSGRPSQSTRVADENGIRRCRREPGVLHREPDHDVAAAAPPRC